MWLTSFCENTKSFEPTLKGAQGGLETNERAGSMLVESSFLSKNASKTFILVANILATA